MHIHPDQLQTMSNALRAFSMLPEMMTGIIVGNSVGFLTISVFLGVVHHAVPTNMCTTMAIRMLLVNASGQQRPNAEVQPEQLQSKPQQSQKNFLISQFHHSAKLVSGSMCGKPLC
jgi:F0F1-type ATP synthase assembly protein I